MLLHAVLAFALVETLVLAALLWVWADRGACACLLVLSLIGVSVWVLGNELPNWLHPHADPPISPQLEHLALVLLSASTLASAVFLHFCVVFCQLQLNRVWVWSA